MGKPTSLILVSLGSFVLFCFVGQAAEPNNVFRHSPVHVELVNKLPGGVTLKVHCQSKNDDLGFHDLAPDVKYEFQFRPNTGLRSTLFFCSFQWPDYDGCGHNCSYLIQPNGPCVINWNTGQYDICNPWNQS
ncbi:hypothetical protein BT93_J0986 [Corymbia citriodora subsp. variegata]|uniref:S-protein homolog n=1 Tax=Corymbia citriodora subsp. variegata TaxID=360336 RepID=A0A8T0CNQ8_CORYI|nr:hypothetical protein BT93_L1001 [Corymbia citriodora subsp. variegata]KAF8010213.1 hypothetical protein BT93_J0986 [Corymbia citriodora subsp. variegata]